MFVMGEREDMVTQQSMDLFSFYILKKLKLRQLVGVLRDSTQSTKLLLIIRAWLEIIKFLPLPVSP